MKNFLYGLIACIAASSGMPFFFFPYSLSNAFFNIITNILIISLAFLWHFIRDENTSRFERYLLPVLFAIFTYIISFLISTYIMDILTPDNRDYHYVYDFGVKASLNLVFYIIALLLSFLIKRIYSLIFDALSR